MTETEKYIDDEQHTTGKSAEHVVDSTANKVWAYFLAWMAFAITCISTAGLIIAWPWLRGASSNDAALVLVSASSAIFFTSCAVGLAARDVVLRRMRVSKSSGLPRSGCLLVTVPTSVIAFFCTCAPVGLIAAGESSVRPAEANWSSQLWIAAWVLGIVSATAVIITKRRNKREAK